MRRIYVETLIKATVDDVWWHTQVPVMHARWDGRFGEISYLPATEPQRFRYATFGVAGIGITTGERIRSDGGGTSSLSFFSANPLSPIRSGSGYWRYVPTPAGVIFLTGYDYRPGWGRAGDLVVRPLMGWLTAWSFDRLRLWLETGMRPEHSRNQALAEVVARAGLVLAAGTLGGAAAALAATVVAIVPPLPGTPAARRCRRTPQDRASYTSSPVIDDRLALP
jgi:hypothetical protein